MSIVKAKRAIVPVGDGISLEALMMPNGEFRLTLTEVIRTIGYSQAWLSSVLHKKRLSTLEVLQIAGFDVYTEGTPIFVEDENFRSDLKVSSFSVDGFLILLAYAYVQGKPQALEMGRKLFNDLSFVTTASGMVFNRAVNSLHSSVATKSNHKKQKRKNEKQIQLELAKREGGWTEVIVESGRIDVLTTQEVIEVKEAINWKSAIGQVLVYCTYYPSHTPRIHLFSSSPIHSSFRKMVDDRAAKLNIRVTWD